MTPGLVLNNWKFETVSGEEEKKIYHRVVGHDKPSACYILQ